MTCTNCSICSLSVHSGCGELVVGRHCRHDGHRASLSTGERSPTRIESNPVQCFGMCMICCNFCHHGLVSSYQKPLDSVNWQYLICVEKMTVFVSSMISATLQLLYCSGLLIVKVWLCPVLVYLCHCACFRLSV